jgi:mRNA interferase MazF
MSEGRWVGPPPDRGDVFIVDLDPVLGSEQAGTRPSVVISPDFMNAGGTVIVVPLTTKKTDRVREYEAFVPTGQSGLAEPSKAKCNQVRTVSMGRLRGYVGTVPLPVMVAIDAALVIAMGIEDRVTA